MPPPPPPPPTTGPPPLAAIGTAVAFTAAVSHLRRTRVSHTPAAAALAEAPLILGGLVVASSVFTTWKRRSVVINSPLYTFDATSWRESSDGRSGIVTKVGRGRSSTLSAGVGARKNVLNGTEPCLRCRPALLATVYVDGNVAYQFLAVRSWLYHNMRNGQKKRSAAWVATGCFTILLHDTVHKKVGHLGRVITV